MTERFRILQFGAHGQVARETARLAKARNVDFVALDRAAADFQHPDHLREIVDAHDVDAVVNAAAYTAVDTAEEERDLAFAVNAAAPGEIAQACAKKSVPLIHISTDYVFDGAKPSPYVETDAPAPGNVYGASKLAGEQAVAAAGGAHVILRTSWIYSPYGKNFVKTILRLAKERDALGIVADQIGAPTAAADIAEAVFDIGPQIAARPETAGLYHFAGGGETSWAGFAQAIVELAGLAPAPKITAIPSADYPTPAKRPANSRLDCAKIARVFGVPQTPWREALARELARIEAD